MERYLIIICYRKQMNYSSTDFVIYFYVMSIAVDKQHNYVCDS